MTRRAVHHGFLAGPDVHYVLIPLGNECIAADRLVCT